MKLYVFGNEYLEGDSFAREVADKLNGVDIEHCHSPEELIDVNPIFALDVVANISEPIRLTEIAQIKTYKLTSLHDIDVGFILNLMESLGIKKDIVIYGVPPTGDLKSIVPIVQKWIDADK